MRPAEGARSPAVVERRRKKPRELLPRRNDDVESGKRMAGVESARELITRIPDDLTFRVNV